jgi:hypothetical protein
LFRFFATPEATSPALLLNLHHPYTSERQYIEVGAGDEEEI